MSNSLLDDGEMSMASAAIHLEPYNRVYLDLSWDWLRDPEIKALTLTPDFTREQQQAFFDALPRRADYKVWGVASDEGEKIGAAGIKHIDGQDGEFWCYIGERTWWLDFDGAGFTTRDALSGELRRDWRLEMVPPYRLTRAPPVERLAS